MKKFALAGAALAVWGAGGTALAADMPLKAPVTAPTVFSWTGFYVGASLGYSWGRADTDFTETTSGTSTTQVIFAGVPLQPTVVTLPTVTAAGSSRANLNGGIGGGQIGYNWQSWPVVYGIESDLQATGERGDTTICITAACPTGSIFGSASYKLPWVATLRGRIGVTATPRVLLYATGGLAIGEVDRSFSGGLNGGPIANVSSNTRRGGYVVGGGVEGALDNHWSAKLEALYLGLGSYDATLPDVTKTTVASFISGPPIIIITTNTTNTTSGSFHSHVTDFIVRLGLNYRFGGPVVAKY